MSYLDDAFLPHLRLTMLRILANAPGYCANSSILHQSVSAMGLRATRDQVRAEVSWLAEQRLVTMQQATLTMSVATITERGLDVQAGLSVIPGVQRPAPEA